MRLVPKGLQPKFHGPSGSPTRRDSSPSGQNTLRPATTGSGGSPILPLRKSPWDPIPNTISKTNPQESLPLKPTSSPGPTKPLQDLLAQAVNAHGQGHLGEAIRLYRAILDREPNRPSVLSNLGMAHWANGEAQEAERCLHAALRMNPGLAPAWNNLGVVHLSSRRPLEAEECFRKAAAADPRSPDGFFNLGKALLQLRRMDEAIEAFRKVHELVPGRAEPLLGISRAHYLQGQLEESHLAATQACALSPGDPMAETCRILNENYHRSLSEVELRTEHLTFGHHYCATVSTEFPPPPPLDRTGRIRLGILGSSFHRHASMQCVMPVLEAHDRTKVELFCYHLGEATDDLTEQLKGSVEHWRACRGMSPRAVVQQIRQDRIAILVGLEGYFDGACIAVLARKAAPIQATWSGYPHSWGLPTVDFRITDPVLDPPGRSQLPGEESLVRLPWFRGFRLPDPAPDPGPLPATVPGQVTFASFNSLAKLSGECLALWSRLLGALPLAKLVVAQAEEGSARNTLADRMRQAGIDLSRVSFLPRLPAEAYFDLHRKVDLNLDSTPYGSVTVAATALWMGLPSVCLNQDWAASREGASQVTAAGFPELVVSDPEAFLSLNIAFAMDLPRLAAFRASARHRMEGAPLLDAVGLARNLEAAYEAMLEGRALDVCGLDQDPA